MERERADSADNGDNPEALQCCRDAVRVGCAADEWGDEAAECRREAERHAGGEANVFAEVRLT
ncbi:MAG: hypothetical protein PUI81_04575, partial [Veillonellaceae bacterium]|nr:hypothetical protein [Veillonellaceae bacterium]